MVNKKGWIRIAEAMIALGIILGVLLFVVGKNKVDVDSSLGVGERLRIVLDEIAKHPAHREEIAERGNSFDINRVKYLLDRHLVSLFYSLKICNSNRLSDCDLSASEKAQIKGEIYVAERAIGATPTNPSGSGSNNLEPKIMKIYAWRTKK